MTEIAEGIEWESCAMDQEAVKMDIITHPDFDALKKYCELLRERLLRLILEKDELVNTIIPNIEAEYQLLIGYLTYEKFCLQTEINKSKRTINKGLVRIAALGARSAGDAVIPG